MDYDKLYELLDTGESVELECKEADGGLPRSIWETYSAFANTYGGMILLGIKESRGSLTVKGVSDTKRLLKEFWDLVNNMQKVSANILNEKMVDSVKVEGKELILINVPRADRRQKPIYIGQNPMIGTYRRNFEGDYKCREDEVKKMIVDQQDETIDTKILANFNMQDINKESVREYRERLASLKPVHPWLGLENKDFLYKIGAWGRDRETGKEGLTLAGLLMFGEERSIMEELPNYFLDYRENLSDEKQVRWTNRITSQEGTWSGNLYDFYFKVINKLTDGLNIPFKMEGYTRKDDTEIHEALREALMNTLVHAEYYGTKGIVIEKRKTFFKFSNPGVLRISLEEAMKGGVSDPRNSSLFKMFILIGIGERAGSGLDKIQTAWKDQSWRVPELSENIETDRTELILRTVSLLPQESIILLESVLKGKYAKLSKDEVITLVAIHQEGEIKNVRLQYLIEILPNEITKMLNNLVKENIIIFKGNGKGRKYYFTEDIKSEMSGVPDNNSGHIEQMSGVPDNNSEHIEQMSKLEEFERIDINDFDESILEISTKSRESKKLKNGMILDMIYEMCKIQSLSLDELSILLSRNKESIRKRYLKNLIEQGRIKPVYENQINHPHQAYRAVK